MRQKVILAFPLIFALIGSIILVAAGDEVEIAAKNDTIVLRQWHFVVMGLVFNALLFVLYRWLFKVTVSKSLFWAHFVMTFGGMTIFLYLMLPLNNGQDLDAMLRGLTWVLAATFFLIVGFICLVVLVGKRLRADRYKVNDSDQ